LPSFCITERRSFAERAPELVALALALGVAGCSREANKTHATAPRGESTAMQPAASAPEANPNAADVPPGTNPSAPNAPPGADPDAPATPPGAKPSGDEASRSLTAERVIAEVRRLGGKGTLVNAWASWCGPCKHELPMLALLAKDLAPRGVHVLLVSLDEPDDRHKATEFLQERGIQLPSYFAERPLGAFKQGMNPRWPGMLPASFLFDATGKLRYYWGGEAFEEELTPVISALAAGKPIQGESDALVAPEGEVH
jgi:thiol-disulfide isomerase/thioredoxin